MADSLLPYFNQELTAIRQLTAEFARKHPKVAGRLRINADTIDDPHVERLLDGVAFLSARAQARLDDEFPEFTDTLLNILYPHYLAPFPSCSISQFSIKPDLTRRVDIPQGFEVETEAVNGQSCRYRTTSPLTLWPIKISSARLISSPFTAPANRFANGAAAVLRLVLTTLSPDVHFKKLELDKLRLFLRGSPSTSMQLYELLSAHTLGIAVSSTQEDPSPSLLPKSSLSEVGFAPEEALLPWPARSFDGFRLLSEYFAFPQKFMFLDISGLNEKASTLDNNQMEIFIYLNKTSSELERTISSDMFALGCTPIVNLFSQRCEPITIDHTKTEYHILPDARRADSMEIWNVRSVREIQQDGTTRPFQPFYRLQSADAPEQSGGPSYLITQRDSATNRSGADNFISLFDPDFNPNKKVDSILSIEALCSNRDLPTDLPYGNGRPSLRSLHPHTGVASISCITPPTPALRQERRARKAWRVISHLSLSHLSITGAENGAIALKEILRLYDLRDTADTRAGIEALLAVTTSASTARVPGARPGAFCRGLNVELEFDSRAFHDIGLYLLTAVLAHFFSLYTSVNSFARTSVRMRGELESTLHFPPRSGSRVLL